MSRDRLQLLDFLPRSLGIVLCVFSHFSHVPLFAILWSIAHQAPLSMGFSRQEYWSGLSCPPHLGIDSAAFLPYKSSNSPGPLRNETVS